MILASAFGTGRLLGIVVLIALVVLLIVRRRSEASPKKPAAKKSAAKPAAARVLEQPVRYVDGPAEPEVERPGSVGPPGT